MKCSNCGRENMEVARYCEYCGEEFLNKDGKKVKQAYKYCLKCGKPMELNTEICSNCGEKENELSNSATEKVRWKTIMIIGGLIGCIFSVYTIINDIDTYKRTWHFSGYNYNPPFVEHEVFIILVLIISGIVLLIGGCMSTKKVD